MTRLRRLILTLTGIYAVALSTLIAAIAAEAHHRHRKGDTRHA